MSAKNASTPMPPISRLLIAAFTLLALTSCTGSYEAPNPVLLVTAYTTAESGTPQHRIGIVRDDLRPNESERLTFLPGSVRDLPAPPQAFDITNRADARNTLVVLSRATADAATTPPSYLTFFNLSRLDGSGTDPTVSGFGPPTGRQQIILSDITGPAIIPRNFPNRDTPLYCPTEIQVSQGGDYAAVLNNPTLCGFGVSQNFIDIFDIRGSGLLLQRINGVAAGGLYVSQSATADILYYATTSASSLLLQRVPLPRPDQTFGPDDTVGTPQTVATVPNQLTQRGFVDLGIAGIVGSERLVVLFGGAVAYVSNYTVTGTVIGPVSARDNTNVSILRDDQLKTSETLVLGSDNRLSVFPSSFTTGSGDTLESGERRARVFATAGVIGPEGTYTYFVGTDPEDGSGLVSLLDLASYTTGATPRVQPYSEGLEAWNAVTPAFVTWAQSVPFTSP